MIAIYLKELKSYFSSILGYLYLAVFTAVTGIYFTSYCVLGLSNEFASYVIPGIAMIFAILVPIMTMRSMAEEKKQKTDQLLLTAPVRVSSIIIGKYLALLTVFIISLLIIGIFPIIASFHGNVKLASTLTGFLGLFLYGALLFAIGLFISTITDNQIVAAVISALIILIISMTDVIIDFIPAGEIYTVVFFAVVIFFVALMFYFDTKSIIVAVIAIVVGGAGTIILYICDKSFFENGFGTVVAWFSFIDRFYNFTSGIIESSSVIFFVTGIFVLLFLSVQSIQRRRWN